MLQLVHSQKTPLKSTQENSPETDGLYEKIAHAIVNSPEENPAGFDLGYEDMREFAHESLNRLSPDNCPDDRDQFIARLMMEGSKTPGGARFVNYALAA